MPPLLVNRHGAVAVVTLDRPDRLNAGDRHLLEALQAAIDDLAIDPDVGALVLTGNGRGFCAGADLRSGSWAPPDLSMGSQLQWILEHHWNPVCAGLARFPKPTVAAVNGVAAGGGVGLALACDIVIAAHRASFVEVFGPQLAVVPDVGSTWLLPRLVGRARARAMCLLGEPVDATTAAAWGLVWRAVPDAELMTEAMATAHRLAGLSPAAMTAIKEILDRSEHNDLEAQLAAEAVAQVDLGDGDFIDALNAWLSKRPSPPS